MSAINGDTLRKQQKMWPGTAEKQEFLAPKKTQKAHEPPGLDSLWFLAAHMSPIYLTSFPIAHVWRTR
jgi:hypothetical protein